MQEWSVQCGIYTPVTGKNFDASVRVAVLHFEKLNSLCNRPI
jgi:hypothetical protein